MLSLQTVKENFPQITVYIDTDERNARNVLEEAILNFTSIATLSKNNLSQDKKSCLHLKRLKEEI